MSFLFSCNFFLRSEVSQAALNAFFHLNSLQDHCSDTSESAEWYGYKNEGMLEA